MGNDNSFRDKARKILQNKAIDGGQADAVNWIALPKSTTVNLPNLQNKEGSVVYDTDQQKVLVYDGSSYVAVGDGVGAVDSVNSQVGDVVLDATDVGAASDTLDNLGVTEINASLLFDADSTYSIGSDTEKPDGIYVNTLFAYSGVENPSGSDLNISSGADINLLGTTINVNGDIFVDGNKEVRFNGGSGGPNYIGITGPSILGSDFHFRLPNTQGDPGDVLTLSDGAGTMVWSPGGGVDTDLSNLTPTAINQSLDPDADLTYNLGETNSRWAALFVATIYDNSGLPVIGVDDLFNRQLFANDGSPLLNFSDVTAIKIKNDTSLTWRNAGDTADITTLKVDSSDNILVGDGTSAITIDGTDTSVIAQNNLGLSANVDIDLNANGFDINVRGDGGGVTAPRLNLFNDDNTGSSTLQYNTDGLDVSTAIRTNDGTITNPSYSFTNSSNSGLWRTGADSYAFNSEGTISTIWTSTSFLGHNGNKNLGDSSTPWASLSVNVPKVKEVADGKVGQAVLVGGTVTVANTSVNANSRIFVTSNVDGGTPGFLRVNNIVNATSFDIVSSSGTDTSTVSWFIVEAF